jgi:hypothetical protein
MNGHWRRDGRTVWVLVERLVPDQHQVQYVQRAKFVQLIPTDVIRAQVQSAEREEFYETTEVLYL